MATLPLVSPPNELLRNERRNSILMTRHYPNLGSASDWSCRVGNLIQQIISTTQIWVVTRIEFLRSFFRRHLAGKPVVASPNVGCFLGLVKSMTYRLDYYEPELLPGKDSCLFSVRNKTGPERAAETSLLFFSSCLAVTTLWFDSPVIAIQKLNSQLFPNYFAGGFLSIPSGAGK